MNRDYWVGRVDLLGNRELIVQAAFHEAGHAAAICLRNRTYELPQKSFRISLRGLKQTRFDNRWMAFGHKEYPAKLEGGLLLDSPVLSKRDSVSSQVVLDYQQAWEADVINLMAGPLAEAKHVAQRDGEHFNRFLVDYDALKNYGGKSDQEKIEDYLGDFSLPKLNKIEKLKELHSSAFEFIDHPRYWRAIARLANYILDSERETIDFEEAIAILDAAIETSYGFGRC